MFHKYVIFETVILEIVPKTEIDHTLKFPPLETPISGELITFNCI